MNPYAPPVRTSEPVADPISDSSSFESHDDEPVYWVGRVLAGILVFGMLAALLAGTG